VSIICGAINEAVRDIVCAISRKNNKEALVVYQMKFSDYHNTLFSELHKTFGTQITYKRRDTVIAEDIPAIPAKAELPIDILGANTMLKSIICNYIVKSSLLLLNDEQIEPKAGDRIIDGKTEYEVINSVNKQCYRPVDSDNNYLRIFVKKNKNVSNY
jgi:hypothetical protein